MNNLPICVMCVILHHDVFNMNSVIDLWLLDKAGYLVLSLRSQPYMHKGFNFGGSIDNVKLHTIFI